MGGMETGKTMPSCLSLSKDAGEGGEALSTLRSLRAWRSGGRVVTAVLALLAAFAATAPASQLPPVAGVGYPNVPIDRGKKVSAFFGYTYGYDSNIEYAASGSEAADYFQEALVGLIYVTGVPARSFDLRYEGKFDFFREQTNLSYMEHAVRGSIVRQTERSKTTALGSAEWLFEPDEIEADGLLENQRGRGALDFALRRGQTEFVLGGSGGVSHYPQNTELGHTNYGLAGEVRLWRGETKHYCLHFDMGAITYAPGGPGVRSDFSYQRLYLGLRGERTARSGYAIALGVQGNDVATEFEIAGDELFVALRSTSLTQNGRGALALSYTWGAEASLVSDYKFASRLGFRYTYAANTRLSLTAGVRFEDATFANKDISPLPLPPPPPGDMARLVWDAGVMYEIGSPQRLHGRLFVSYGMENRGGPSAPINYNYARTRWFGGVALVY